MTQWMKEEDIRALVGEVEDVITPAVKQRREFFARTKCPACGGNVHPEVTLQDIERMRGDEVIPTGHARCASCNCLFEPHLGLIIQKGDVTRLLEPAVTLINPDKD